MDARFKLFDDLLKASGVSLQKGDQILVLENPDVEKLYEVLGTNHEQMTAFPELDHLIENHIINKLATNTIQMVSGATFSYVPNKVVDGIAIHKAYSINGMEYIPFDGILMTAADDDALREYLEKIEGTNPQKVKRKTAVPRVPFEQAKAKPATITSTKKLERMGVSTISNAGWGELEPKRGAERTELKEKCGDACFLRPEDNAFPICPKLSKTDGKCQVSCAGLGAAKTRARFLPPEFKEKVIPDLQEHFGCKGVASGGVVERKVNNSWVNFSKKRRVELKKDRPDMTGADITKMISVEWSKMTQKEKDSYK